MFLGAQKNLLIEMVLLSTHKSFLNEKPGTRGRWGAIANPHAKVFDPQHPKSHPWGIIPTTE